ncbi:Insulin receptor tyrosine kinase substrate [Nesidiocoris tenuis]|uniref:Insulin receptor tyrosine kinase substrate n=1 Tax=Nesidiocoris tenuis TaxID=355587 RepID=A0ABN7BGQ2_9HEMI|nr:Insulin receptor tyrosine kinase substrate [Nesidiocoris tenuis]
MLKTRRNLARKSLKSGNLMVVDAYVRGVAHAYRCSREMKPMKSRGRDADTLRSWLGDDWNDSKSTLTRTMKQESRIERVQRQLNAMELPYEKKVKRTKSLWRLRRNEDVIEGMAMWRHRSLIELNDDSKTLTLKKVTSLIRCSASFTNSESPGY